MATIQRERISYDKPITKIRKALLESGMAQQINERSGTLSENSQVVLEYLLIINFLPLHDESMILTIHIVKKI